eukprot:PITA_05658
MRSVFLKKYQAYCRSRDSKEYVFRMTQQEDESLEEYLERFSYNLQKSKQHSLNQETIRTIFLKGVRDDYLDILNVMGKGDISNLLFEEIVELCQKYSRGRSKIGKREVSSKAAKSAAGGITRAEIGNLLENFKTDLLSTLGTQVDVLKANKKKEEQEQALAIFCSKCRKKHPLRECPLDSIQYQQHYQQQYQQPFPYPQYPQSMPFPQQNFAYPPSMPFQQQNPPPLLTQPQQLQLPSNQPRPTQLPAQSVANPNNKVDKSAYTVEEAAYFPTYSILPLNDVHLSSGKVLKKDSPPIIEEPIEQGESPETSQTEIQIQKGKTITTQTPPYPERLVEQQKEITLPEFDILDELKNAYVKIPLLKAIKEIPIYAKTIKELCIKKSGKKKKDPTTIQVIGKLASLMSTQTIVEKYIDPSIPMVTISINNFLVPNTLIDLGAAINVMTIETMKTLHLNNIRSTSTILELADRSKVVLEGILEDIIVSLDSWEYPVDFLILQPKANLGGHPLILGRPWLATADAFIGCRLGSMIISHGDERKHIALYPPAQSTSLESVLETQEKQQTKSVLSINQFFDFREEEENEDLMDLFISEPSISEQLREVQYEAASDLLNQCFQETCTVQTLRNYFIDIFPVNTISNPTIKIIEVYPGKHLNIGNQLQSAQKQEVIALLQKYSKAFASDYTDMQGIHPSTCIHHIYIDDQVKPVRQPQRRMNPMMKEIVKEELQKLLNVGFIYSISDSQWVSPLVIVPKKMENGGYV